MCWYRCAEPATKQVDVEAAGQTWLNDAQQMRSALDATLTALSNPPSSNWLCIWLPVQFADLQSLRNVIARSSDYLLLGGMQMAMVFHAARCHRGREGGPGGGAGGTGAHPQQCREWPAGVRICCCTRRLLSSPVTFLHTSRWRLSICISRVLNLICRATRRAACLGCHARTRSTAAVPSAACACRRRRSSTHLGTATATAGRSPRAAERRRRQSGTHYLLRRRRISPPTRRRSRCARRCRRRCIGCAMPAAAAQAATRPWHQRRALASSTQPPQSGAAISRPATASQMSRRSPSTRRGTRRNGDRRRGGSSRIARM